jgi:hypothetical protein
MRSAWTPVLIARSAPNRRQVRGFGRAARSRSRRTSDIPSGSRELAGLNESAILRSSLLSRSLDRAPLDQTEYRPIRATQ